MYEILSHVSVMRRFTEKKKIPINGDVKKSPSVIYPVDVEMSRESVFQYGELSDKWNHEAFLSFALK